MKFSGKVSSDLITFWVNSGKPRDAAMLGGGVCCAAHHSLFTIFTEGRHSLLCRASAGLTMVQVAHLRRACELGGLIISQ